MEKKNFNEVLKQREQQEKKAASEKGSEMALDSLERVKVLSPGRLVFNRFIRNKLAIVGSALLILMFVFAFLIPILYPYSQTEIFYKYDRVMVDYAVAMERTEFSTLMLDKETSLPSSVKNNLNATIIKMKADGKTEASLEGEGNSYVLSKDSNDIYSLYAAAAVEVCSMSEFQPIASYNRISKELQYTGENSQDEGFASAIQDAVDNKSTEFSYQEYIYRLTPGKKGVYTIDRKSNGIEYTGSPMGEEFEALIRESLEKGKFEYEGNSYSVSGDQEAFTVYRSGERKQIAYLTTLVFDAYDDPAVITDEFRLRAIEAAVGNGSFILEGTEYVIEEDGDERLVYAGSHSQVPSAAFSNLAVRASSGEDSMEFAYKEKVREMIDAIEDQGIYSTTFEWEIPQLNEDGEYAYDEDGNIIKELTEVRLEKKNDSYAMSCEQVTYLIDIYAQASKTHWFGTDGDGMDVLARMMYGGRVSLMVCFVVIILEVVIGVIMGGIAGFFGGFIDNIIMRMVDIFYCIPSMPILIIMGALFDAQKLEPYVRLVWLMVILGILGWASIARLVRGQILSLREQEFMVAAEAIGLRNKRRIFRHLVPNVMPQLIVTASSGLGGIIITESTLSFLGLGVKHPLATWGTMINSVTASSEAMIRYTYIWVPVGLLICLTVVAFNFVGDGLRDAFDPKMKR